MRNLINRLERVNLSTESTRERELLENFSLAIIRTFRDDFQKLLFNQI
jgi:hypothetical protein